MQSLSPILLSMQRVSWLEKEQIERYYCQIADFGSKDWLLPSCVGCLQCGCVKASEMMITLSSQQHAISGDAAAVGPLRLH